MLFNVPFDDMRMRFCVYNTNIRIMCVASHRVTIVCELQVCKATLKHYGYGYGLYLVAADSSG